MRITNITGTGLIALTILLIAGCSGGGGGGGGGATPAPDPGGSTKSIGTRSLPDCDVAVTRNGAVTAGKPISLRIAVTGALAPASVGVHLGTDYDAAAVFTTATAAGTGLFDVSLTVPDPIPAGLRAWIRITGAGGEIEESGGDDFALLP